MCFQIADKDSSPLTCKNITDGFLGSLAKPDCMRLVKLKLKNLHQMVKTFQVGKRIKKLTKNKRENEACWIEIQKSKSNGLDVSGWKKEKKQLKTRDTKVTFYK